MGGELLGEDNTFIIFLILILLILGLNGAI
jgi:hypothetical protein